MVGIHPEDILVFSKTHPKHDFEGAHPLREYFQTNERVYKSHNKRN